MPRIPTSPKSKRSSLEIGLDFVLLMVLTLLILRQFGALAEPGSMASAEIEIQAIDQDHDGVPMMPDQDAGFAQAPAPDPTSDGGKVEQVVQQAERVQRMTGDLVSDTQEILLKLKTEKLLRLAQEKGWDKGIIPSPLDQADCDQYEEWKLLKRAKK